MASSRRTDQPGPDRLWDQPNPCPSCGRTMQLRRHGPASGVTEIGGCGCAECGIWVFDAPPLADISVPNAAPHREALPR